MWSDWQVLGTIFRFYPDTTGGNAPEDYFDPERWTDPHVLAIADLVQPYAMEIPAGDAILSSRVEIVLRDGRRLEHYQRGFHGHPESPATREQIVTKFRANARSVLSAAATDAVEAAVLGLAQAPNVRALTALLGAPTTPPIVTRHAERPHREI